MECLSPDQWARICPLEKGTRSIFYWNEPITRVEMPEKSFGHTGNP